MRLTLIFLVLSGLAAPAGQPQDPLRSRAAYLLIDVGSRKTIASSRPDILQAPTAPGSIAKVATLIAALEERVIEPGTRLACTRRVTVGGHDLTCVHPNLNRPMSSAEALAHSCNSFFATVAGRLPRPALNRAFMSMGLPPSEEGDVVAAALGLAPARTTPSGLLDALIRVATNTPPMRIRDETRQVVIDGLKGAASFGTATAFGAKKIDALAKTGTAPAPGGGVHGMVVAVAPSASPSFGVVVVAPGAAGADAASLAADLVQEQMPAVSQSTTPDLIRVGRTNADGPIAVAPMTIEDYVAAVVAGEQHASSPTAALEALAITARTYALSNRRRHAREGFDLCDLTHCQVLRAATAPARAAASATRGRILLYEGRAASVFYTASCGGRTERGDAVWPQAKFPFLPSQMDVGCERLPPWTSEIRKEDLERALVASGLTGRLDHMRVASRSASGRVAALAINGFSPPQIDGDRLRFAIGRTLGWQHVKSTLFDLTRTSTGYRFTGRGSGHGVGLCMVGSIRWASHGLHADDILHRYFPGLVVGSDNGDGEDRSDRVRLELPAIHESERRHLSTFIDAELRGLARRLGVSAPADVLVVFHPTVESYRRVTKQPWWMSGASSGGRIDLLPVSTLRSRGLLEQTIRHELVHVLTADSLRERPIWVKEGAALHFAGEVIPPAGPASASCPPKASVTASSHRDATRREYLAAGTCFAKAVAAGQKWSDIR